jgi:hypothetical protein
VGCLYCGKEIGPIRLLRDREFCSAAHRQGYHSRLGKALGQLAIPEEAPAGLADFQVSFPVQEAKSSSVCAGAEFGYLSRTVRTQSAWPVSVAPAMGGSFRGGVGLPGIVQPQGGDSVAAPMTVKLRMPRLELAAMGGIADVDERATPAAPAMCDRWLRTGAPDVAERMVFPQVAAAMIFPKRDGRPTMGAVPLPCCSFRIVEETAECAPPEPVEIFIVPVMESRPAMRNAPLAQLRFGMHAVEDMAPAPFAAAGHGIPPLAGAVAGPAAEPVESMPLARGRALQTMPSAPPLRLPSLGRLTRPAVLAGAAPPPAAVPVETMPSVGLPVPQTMWPRLPLKKPNLAHFQIAEEPSNALAAPAEAPEPMPVEALPWTPGFVARPAAAPLMLMRQTLQPPMPARLTAGGFQGAAAPQPAEPVPQKLGKTALAPLSRIAAAPAGTQPERPKPEIPHPPLFPLEYYCHRIVSQPVNRLGWMVGEIELRQQAFQMTPDLRPFAEYGARPRKILPFEEIFASQRKKDGEPARVRLSAMGKIAATIMVGVALWGGSRLAGLTDHAAALQARVASSERTVTAAAEVRRSQMGNGPVARIRRAIADRAATEVTDTFNSGMEAWGAGTKTWAPGWQHSPDGYVKTGEMALFRPSLNYTDYHMEFYGQIEEKSMGWVVRAQDKKNYYAMKFKVIEPGLRPVIAMVHYEVLNGKRGHLEEMPLPIVMIHNNQPYHVSVDVRGNHFVAAIEGEPVQSWTDDAPSKGGVGFFSDTGERARLYWMKIARNQDWLGRFCAYVSGDSASVQQTAEAWGPEPAHDRRTPEYPRAPDAALALAGVWTGIARSPRRAKISKKRRSEA